ncbi:hypothetical protein ACFUN7_38805 [Streptomyces sp. NPDC057236]|uniref:hypothetical protein n=1 Tax=Streptomyces sp. NPDC057236 TaxID=3346059 RepID=UPI00362A663F
MCGLTGRFVVVPDLVGVTGEAGRADRRDRVPDPPGRFGHDGDALGGSLSGPTVRPGGAVSSYAAARPAERTAARDVSAGRRAGRRRPPWPRPLEDPPSRALTSLDDLPGAGVPVLMGQ